MTLPPPPMPTRTVREMVETLTHPPLGQQGTGLLLAEWTLPVTVAPPNPRQEASRLSRVTRGDGPPVVTVQTNSGAMDRIEEMVQEKLSRSRPSTRPA